jgi:serine/threonine protein kinase
MVGSCSIETGCLLGQGASGTVYLGMMKTFWKKKKVAVKMFDFSKVSTRESYLTEAQAYKAIRGLGSKYFAKVYTIQQTGTAGRVVMKLYDGDLFEYSQHYGEFEECYRAVFAAICTGVQLLHANGIAHLDLKADNILMKNNKPYIADFGAIFVEGVAGPVQASRFFRGTNVYACPEISNNEYFNPYKADIFSLGVLLHTCLTRTFPYLSGTRIVDLGYARQILSRDAVDLISKMISNSRITIDEVLAHPWLNKQKNDL